MKVASLVFFNMVIALIFIKSYTQNSTLFTQIPSSVSGVTFNNVIVDDKEKNILLYSNFYGGAGVGIGDFNNDGLEDIYFAGNLVDDKLYLNLGDFKFKDISKSAGIVNDGSWSTSVTVADVNRDGLLDIYVTKELYDYKPELRKNKLYINQGNASFKEMAESYGVANDERTRGATFLDYNKDGLLDLFILNQPPNPGSYSDFFGTKLLRPEFTSILYKNVNGTSFVDVTQEAGLQNAGFPNAVSASDFNNDGWTDLYIANDFYAPDVLYINNHNGTFTNIINKAFNHMSYYSMGVDVVDINDDGFLDIFVVDMVAEDNFRLKSNMSGMNPSAFWNVVNNGGHYQYMFNNLHLNNGNNSFSEIAQLANIAATDWSWSPLIADFDNDGERDLYVTNGLLRDIRNTDASKAVGEFVVQTANTWVKDHPDGGEVSIWDILDLDKTLNLLPSQPLSNFMYKNNGSYYFEKVTSDWGLDQKSFSNGAAYADFDNDGDLDLVVNNINEEAFVYKNNATNNFLRLKLKSKANNSVFGAKVSIKSDGKSKFAETTNVRGIYSTSEQTVHFGLGSTETVDELVITWPDSREIILNNVKSNQVLSLYMEDATILSKNDKKNKSTLLSNITDSNKLVFKHQENDFDDFKYQVLLPHKLSQFGPALAIDDVNNDGLKDVFVGGAAGFSGKLYLQNDEGNFENMPINAFENDRYSEDLDAVFFDVDKDGDNDLYVVSGGNEYQKGDDSYKDRLYINDGNGHFIKDTKALNSESISGSVVIPADFDKDGDLDIFVGGRLSPRDYPSPTNSQLLENRDGKLIDVTKKIAPELLNLGMVTDAIWSDYDNDNDLDLIIVGEWMPISVFKNNAGNFSKEVIPSLANTEGWWYSIEQGDFDKDGNMDFIVGNLGLNYKYKASTEAPFDVYYDDFDDNNSKDIVLGYYQKNKHYPVRGFSCSSQQVPELKHEIKKYDIFASLEIQDIYGEKKLDKALYYKAQTFATSYIHNLGNNEFKISKLPIEAQFSSVNDIVISDINEDGNLDIILAGNLFVSEIETPRNDAGIGVVLIGDGKNRFKSLNYAQSGFFVNRDVKKVKLLEDKNHKLLFIANNNDVLEVFNINENNHPKTN